jgi:Major capsid protein N-terminus
MAGGLFNFKDVAAPNYLIHSDPLVYGNPPKTLFTRTYAKITNFGLQKFRLDFDGSREIRLAEDSTFTFKVKRYGHLLMDAYVVITLPDIWSPLYHPVLQNNYQWTPYEFRWIRNLGAQMIRSVEITCGAQLLHKYTGEYLQAVVNRDFTADKKDLFARMTGDIPELNDPSMAFGRTNTYPSAYVSASASGAEPSIRGRTLYIPVNSWFSLDSRCAFPLVALQSNELTIAVTIRPIQELFQVRDVFDSANQFPYVQPDFNQEQFQMYRFLQTPPSVRTNAATYENTRRTWNADVHMLATYGFLSDAEAAVFAQDGQAYLVKDVFQYNFHNITGTTRAKLTSSGMVSGWMWFLQRNDVHMRNEWGNYTNWPYQSLPSNVQLPTANIPYNINSGVFDANLLLTSGPAYNPDGSNTGLFVSGDFSLDNRRDILETLGVIFDGDYRDVFDYAEKYARSSGGADDGLYCYSFAINSSSLEYQPSGAINMGAFKTVELEISTFVPQTNPEGAMFSTICDSAGAPIGVRDKPSWKLYQYNYNMTLFEERYNVVSFFGGNCGMLYAR